MPQLTDAEINGSNFAQHAAHQMPVQGDTYVPIVVNLSAEKTLGTAILEAIEADAQLAAALGNKSEVDLLTSITAVAFQTTGVEIRAYPGATVHKYTIAYLGEYKPAVRIWRSYMAGPAAVTLDLIMAL